jgi:hypothetical protein
METSLETCFFLSLINGICISQFRQGSEKNKTHPDNPVNPVKKIKEYNSRKGEVTRFMQNALLSETESRSSVGLGTDLRMESKKINGFALALGDKILHLSLFAQVNENRKEKRGSRMQRYTRRRQNRVYCPSK